ncbi:hypothetical protein FXO37_10334 [Capsicum annuum]|nr:hypothetical protein FXO37_10334 [Capsicum annuum]
MATTGSASVCLNQHSVLIPTQLKGVSLTSRISVPTRFYSNGFTSRIRASSAVAVEQPTFTSPETIHRQPLSPHHLSLASRILSFTETTPTFSNPISPNMPTLPPQEAEILGWIRRLNIGRNDGDVNGLRINLAKSSIFSINADENIEELANILGCKVEKVPSVYLGLPLGEKRWTVASGMGCYFCNSEEETVGHLSIHCRFSRQCWALFFSIMGISLVLPEKISGLLEVWKSQEVTKSLKPIWRTISIA